MSPLPDSRWRVPRGGDAALDLRSMRTFLRQWVRDPVRTASVAPSGRQLARLMVAQLPVGCTRVVEIGAGTGVFTQALLAAGIAPRQLLVVEINPQLADFLRARPTPPSLPHLSPVLRPPTFCRCALSPEHSGTLWTHASLHTCSS